MSEKIIELLYNIFDKSFPYEIDIPFEKNNIENDIQWLDTINSNNEYKENIFNNHIWKFVCKQCKKTKQLRIIKFDSIQESIHYDKVFIARVLAFYNCCHQNSVH